MYRTFQNNSIWNEMGRLQRDMNMLAGMFAGMGQVSAHAFPAMNLWSNEEQALVTVEIPGVKIENLEITVSGDTLTLKGSRQPDAAADNASTHRQERGSGQFVRNIRLPFAVEADHVEASLKNGVLQIQLPRANSDKPHKINISTLN
jgi:HSP20 family protein